MENYYDKPSKKYSYRAVLICFVAVFFLILGYQSISLINAEEENRYLRSDTTKKAYKIDYLYAKLDTITTQANKLVRWNSCTSDKQRKEMIKMDKLERVEAERK